jgi:hypothetical protein
VISVVGELKIIFRPKREELSEGCRLQLHVEVHYSYYESDVTKVIK